MVCGCFQRRPRTMDLREVELRVHVEYQMVRVDLRNVLGVEGDDETLDARDVDGLVDGTRDAFEVVEVCIPICGG